MMGIIQVCCYITIVELINTAQVVYGKTAELMHSVGTIHKYALKVFYYYD